MESSECRKLFVGGLRKDTDEEKLKEHFKRYGEVTEAVVLLDKCTGHGRGFGFVKFSDSSMANNALQDDHVIDGRKVDVKPAIPKDCKQELSKGRKFTSEGSAVANTRFTPKKIFVGGLPAITEEEFKGFFRIFGEIIDGVVMSDPTTGKSRGFGFITFDSELAVDKVLQSRFYWLKDKLVEVKRAEPKKSDWNDGNMDSYIDCYDMGSSSMNDYHSYHHSGDMYEAVPVWHCYYVFPTQDPSAYGASDGDLFIPYPVLGSNVSGASSSYVIVYGAPFGGSFNGASFNHVMISPYSHSGAFINYGYAGMDRVLVSYPDSNCAIAEANGDSMGCNVEVEVLTAKDSPKTEDGILPENGHENGGDGTDHVEESHKTFPMEKNKLTEIENSMNSLTSRVFKLKIKCHSIGHIKGDRSDNGGKQLTIRNVNCANGVEELNICNENRHSNGYTNGYCSDDEDSNVCDGYCHSCGYGAANGDCSNGVGESTICNENRHYNGSTIGHCSDGDDQSNVCDDNCHSNGLTNGHCA